MPSIAPPAVAKATDLSPRWFRVGLAVITIISLGLRFWGLSRFNTLVFDEVYYARFASHFLKGELIFTGHPPLSTYIIALGIWIGDHWLPGGDSPIKNGLSGLLLSPFSYRWLNAIVGAVIPLIVAAIAYHLSHRRRFALLAALLMAIDGLFLVESRYALNNVYLVSFGLLGHLCFLYALQYHRWSRWIWLVLAGMNFGAAAAIKWNGLGFLLGIYSIWGVAWLVRRPMRLSLPLAHLRQLHLGHLLIGLVLVPALTYYVSWLPYLQLDPNNTFWNTQLQTLGYHQRVGGVSAHPYCSQWFTWPLMIRPIAYFYQTAHAAGEAPPVIGPPTPANAGQVIYDVHAMGNPFLWWLSTAAVLLAIGLLLQLLGQWVSDRVTGTRFDGEQEANGWASSLQFGATGWILLYLLVNWGANFFPWAKVTRCVFLYHYMESLVFAVLVLALLLDRWLQSPQRWTRLLSTTILSLVVLAFIFWMPLYLGLPLSPGELQIRRWLPTWI